ncbi:MAG: HD domain-containing protein [Clostridium sp.]|nr:HD domain-containing protein [Clostridium sp.]
MVKDEIYGNFTLEPVLIDLINSKAIQRLKNIHQGGATFLINDKYNVTRFEHSIGVMLLVNSLGGSLEEQIAALLHDVSHTAFSHVIDYVFDNRNEDYHENIFDKIIENSDIPDILRKYNMNYKKIMNGNNFILEASLPKLCADRIDYTLRDMINTNIISLNEAHMFLKSLVIHNETICINNLEMAKWFTNIYYKEVIDYFLEPLSVFANDSIVKIIKEALDENIIDYNSFLLDDYSLLNIIKNSKLKDKLLNINPSVALVHDEVNFDIHMKNKVRVIDPNVLINGEIFKASDLSNNIKEINKNALDKATKGIFLRIV